MPPASFAGIDTELERPGANVQQPGPSNDGRRARQLNPTLCPMRGVLTTYEWRELRALPAPSGFARMTRRNFRSLFLNSYRTASGDQERSSPLYNRN